MIFTLPPLPYDADALEPAMSRETIEYHYGKHLQTYVDNLNRLTAGTPLADSSLEEIILTSTGPVFNNAAQVWNHTFFFNSLTPEQEPMPDELSLVPLVDSFQNLIKNLFCILSCPASFSQTTPRVFSGKNS